VTMLANTLDNQRMAEVAGRVAALVPPRLPDALHLPMELVAAGPNRR